MPAARALRQGGFHVRAAGWLILAAAGCVTSASAGAGDASDYGAVRDRWTRSASEVHAFHTALDVTATWLSWEVRRAQAARLVEWYRLEGAAADAERARQRADSAEAHVIHLAVRTHADDWGEFGRDHVLWRVTLVDDRGRALEPSRVERVEVDALTQALYPYADEFSRSYRFRFPRAHADGTPVVGADTRWVALRFAGPLGSVDLKWDLR